MYELLRIFIGFLSTVQHTQFFYHSVLLQIHTASPHIRNWIQTPSTRARVSTHVLRETDVNNSALYKRHSSMEGGVFILRGYHQRVRPDSPTHFLAL